MAKKFDFNTGLKELEELVKKLESSDLSLDDSIENFEKGVKLSRQCKTALDNAKQKITTLSNDNDYTEETSSK